MAQTTKPSGLKITRKNSTFTASWKIPKGGYDDAQLAQYAIGSGGWKKLTDSKTATKKAFTVDLSDYFPAKKTKLKEVKIRVQGNSKGAATTVSDWSTKTFKIEAPKKPSLSTSTGEYITKFSWKVHDKDDDKYWFKKVEWESVLYKNSSETEGKNISFKADKAAINKGYVKNTKLSGSSTKSDYSKSITEDGATLADGNSYTRWFRIKAFGPAGESKWVYKKHTYALPKVATIDKKTKVTKSKDELNYKCNVYFNTGIGTQHPAEKVEIKYLMTVPGVDLSCPSGASWTTAATPVINKNVNSEKEKYSGYDNSGGTTFFIGDTLDADQCLFLRADVTHDTKTVPGRPYLVKINDVPGVLSDPEDFDVQPNTSEHTAYITVTNKSQVPDSKILIAYNDKRIDKIQYIGIIDHNSSSTIIKYPETDTTPKFGAMAFVGDIKDGSGDYLLTEDTTVTEGKTYYYLQIYSNDDIYEDPIDDFPYTIAESLSKTLSYTPENGSMVSLRFNYNDSATSYLITFLKGTSETKTTGIYYNGEQYTIYATYDGNKTFSGIRFDRQINSPNPLVYTLNVSAEYKTMYPAEGQSTGIYKSILNPSGNPKEQGWYETYSVPYYNIDPIMQSNIIWDGGAIITSPQNMIAERYDDISGTIRVTWDWAWDEANAIELSWADHIDAWESTDEPSSYTVTKLYASAWNISGLETGKKWYVRARYISGLGDSSSYGIYSDIYTVDLTSAPLIPSITLNPSTITEDGETTATWTYSSTDGTLQASAELVEVTVNNEGKNVYTPLDNVQILTAQHYTISAADQGWHYGESHNIAVKVVSDSGVSSDDYSVPDTVTIAEPATCVIANTSLEPYTSQTTDEQGQTVTEIINALRDMPMTVKVISGYDLSSDTTVDSSKTYYTRTDIAEYSYEAIEEPQGNPKEQGWYELSNGNYVLTTDEEVNLSKTYYSRNGDPNYVYSSVASPSGNPSTSNYYEEVLVDEGSVITLVIYRAESYDVDRPDETHYGVFENETMTLLTANDRGNFTITLNDLIGDLDDGAKYVLEATVQDGLGQTATDDISFEVHWVHQAVAPTVSVSIDEEETIAILTPIAPADQDDILHYDTKLLFPVSGASNKIYISDNDGKLYEWNGSDYVENTDVCDIYRLSIDKPELIYKGATFGTTYVDPYPTIGEYGGHRFVTRTINGDYITGDAIKGDFAWTDTKKDEGDIFETHSNIIDFEGGRAFVLYEVDISNSWSKDFKETKYLGGHIQGDWNRGVSRTGSINVTAVSDYDQEMIQIMRRLAAYPGICHVRSKDGSSYSADVQVNETYEYTRAPRFNKYDLSITRVDSEGYDGVTYQEWQETHEQES